MKYLYRILAIASLSICHLAISQAATTSEQQSIDLSIAFLRDRMDEFHNRLPVYDDVSSAGNHFHAFAAIGKPSNLAKNVTVNGSWIDNPHTVL